VTVRLMVRAVPPVGVKVVRSVTRIAPRRRADRAADHLFGGEVGRRAEDHAGGGYSGFGDGALVDFDVLVDGGLEVRAFAAGFVGVHPFLDGGG
jgi:hypothetical protein